MSNLDSKGEVWKDIPNFQGAYQASSSGKIRSLDRYVGHNYGGMRMLTGRALSLSTLPGGYKIVSLRANGTTHRCRVSRLVLSAFCGLPSEGMAACHNDNNPSNNSASNLRWDTYAGNERDKVLAGTSNAGERNHFARLTALQVHEIRSMLSAGETGRSLAEKYGVSPSNISAIKSGRSWATGT